MIPLLLKLKKQQHKDIAVAQDIIITQMYRVFDKAVIHGGTAIWRCYQGSRFSEDIDVYIPRDLQKIEHLFENFRKAGFIIEKKKISENSIFSNLLFQRTAVRFEALFKNEDGILKEFETAEGNFITVYTLTPEQFVLEKVETYLKRRKVRDLYDLFFLLRYVRDTKAISQSLERLKREYQTPLDEQELQILILGGIVPLVEKMKEYIFNYGN